MGICVFKTGNLRRIVRHALQSKQWSMGYDYPENLPAAPALLFVHDSGVYCMSSGIPRDMVNKDSAFCAYAEGCDPGKDEDYYEQSRELVGGDDFVETLLVNEEFLASCETYTEMVINVSEKELNIIFRRPKVKKAV